MKHMIYLFLSLSLALLVGCSSAPKRWPNAGGGVTGDIGRSARDQVMKCYSAENNDLDLVIETSLNKQKKTETVAYMDSSSKQIVKFTNLAIMSNPEVVEMVLANRLVTITSTVSDSKYFKSMVLNVNIVSSSPKNVGHVLLANQEEQTHLINVNCQFEK